MADSFQLEIATPERRIFNERVREAELPGEAGYLGVLPDHAALMTVLAPGIVSYQNESGIQLLVIDGGFAEVFDNNVRVVVTHAEPAAEVSAEQARRELEEAWHAVRRADKQPDSDQALRALRRAQARVEAAERTGGAGRT
jgi:F-type H+-transporting ATPase subunit epsilon